MKKVYNKQGEIVEVPTNTPVRVSSKGVFLVEENEIIKTTIADSDPTHGITQAQINYISSQINGGK